MLRLTLWFVRVVTWNDYSESSYVTGIKGSLPLNSAEWVTGYDHTSQYILSYPVLLPYQHDDEYSFPSTFRLVKDDVVLHHRLQDRHLPRHHQG